MDITTEIGNSGLKELLRSRDTSFWPAMAERTKLASTFSELISLSSLRKKALSIGIDRSILTHEKPIRIALIGGSTLYPLSDLMEHLLFLTVGNVELFTGDFNNYRAEILDEASPLYSFQPGFVFLIPDDRSCRYVGELDDDPQLVRKDVERVSSELLDLCSVVRERSLAEVILCNFILPAVSDPGPIRTRSAASDWNFRKSVNLAIGTQAPNYVHICDMEFLAYRLGGAAAKDARTWYETKQLYSPKMQIEVGKEVAHLIGSLHRAPKKVLVLDLDNTLWGGVVGDDGIESIEIGDTTARGEAFKAFQSFISSLTSRGILLAVCSKNDFEIAIEPFRTHPEMVLHEEDFVSFKANWEPKGQNIIAMASEMELGLDSFVFVDDNPAEIENVRQFAPEVTTILLGPDPSLYISQLQESRLFERSTITPEDRRRTDQYREEASRKSLLNTAVDMDAYLASLEMVGTCRVFNTIDLPRIAQLINKSNQFNLTTKRRTEAELCALMSDPAFLGFSMRLADRFGDHGLISVIICHAAADEVLEIDTWLMSCRVLKRQVEDEVLNHIFRLAAQNHYSVVRGTFIQTQKNSMVKDLFPRLGFTERGVSDQGHTSFERSVNDFTPIPTFITINNGD